jgi:ankyrin repeat protein
MSTPFITDNKIPLHFAFKRWDLKKVSLLIEKGGSVNALATENETSLHLASKRGDLEIVVRLGFRPRALSAQYLTINRSDSSVHVNQLRQSQLQSYDNLQSNSPTPHASFKR